MSKLTAVAAIALIVALFIPAPALATCYPGPCHYDYVNGQYVWSCDDVCDPVYCTALSPEPTWSSYENYSLVYAELSFQAPSYWYESAWYVTAPNSTVQPPFTGPYRTGYVFNGSVYYVN